MGDDRLDIEPGLDQRQSKPQHQRLMPGFRYHFEAPSTGAAEAAAPGLAP